MQRRNFIKKTSLAGMAFAIANTLQASKENKLDKKKEKSVAKKVTKPLVIATWNVQPSVQRAWKELQKGNSSLDAVEQGCRIAEADKKNQTVGNGGRPDRDGDVTLDACIMDKNGNYGAVVYLQHITHAISVARKVMEDTPHVILAGKGAEKFALEKGFQPENLLTKASKKDWETWKLKSKYKPIINIENHDTIGILAMDANGDISGACTTSGLAYKMAGRVGDSPIIGAGLFVDNEVGAAVATGLGEEVLKTVGSFLIVELMRQGKSPQEACKEAIARIVNKVGSKYKNFQVGYIAMNKKGETGFYAIHKGFNMTKFQDGKNKNLSSEYYIKNR